MADQYRAGVLDTCAYIVLDVLDPRDLPTFPQLTSVTVAELHQGVAMAKDARSRATRTEQLGAAMADFEPLPFDGAAATRYGTLVGMTLVAGRDPRPRKMDLMIAAISSTRGLPLYTRNPGDFKGLDELVTVIAL